MMSAHDLLIFFGIVVASIVYVSLMWWATMRALARKATTQRIIDDLAAPMWRTPMPRSEADVRRIVREELNNQSQEK